MSQVLICEIDKRTITRLKLRAKQHGRSLEAELGTILNQAVANVADQPHSQFEAVRALFANKAFEDCADLIRADRKQDV